MVGTAEHAGNFSTFVSAIRTAGLESALDGPGPFTLFAPTDAAFRKLPAGSVEGLLNDRGRLTSFLKGHVVPGNITAKDSFSTKSVKTLEGGDINFETCDDLKVNGAKVVAPDIEARNGVLHGVDSVLIPVEPPARTAAAAPTATPAPAAAKQAPSGTAVAAVPAPAKEKAGEGEHAHTTAGADAKRTEHAPKCGAGAPARSAVKEKVAEEPAAKTTASPPAGGKDVPRGTVVKERVVERPREKTVTKEVISDRPIAQCTTCGKEVSGGSAEEAKRKLTEHEKVHQEAAARSSSEKSPAATPASKAEGPSSNVCSCATCGEEFTGTTSKEAHGHLAEHEKATKHRGTIGEALHGGAEKLRGGAREGLEKVHEGAQDVRGGDTGSEGSGNVSGKAKETGREASGRTGTAAAGAAGAIGAGAGAVAGSAKGLLGRAGDALRGGSGQHSLRCPDCGQEVSGATREEAQANLREHGKVHQK